VETEHKLRTKKDALNKAITKASQPVGLSPEQRRGPEILRRFRLHHLKRFKHKKQEGKIDCLNSKRLLIASRDAYRSERPYSTKAWERDAEILRADKRMQDLKGKEITSSYEQRRGNRQAQRNKIVCRMRRKVPVAARRDQSAESSSKT